MNDGLILVTEQDIVLLSRGEILEKEVESGGTVVNIRLVQNRGISHDRVLELARARGFKRPTEVVPAEPKVPEPPSNPAVVAPPPLGAVRPPVTAMSWPTTESKPAAAPVAAAKPMLPGDGTASASVVSSIVYPVNPTVGVPQQGGVIRDGLW